MGGEGNSDDYWRGIVTHRGSTDPAPSRFYYFSSTTTTKSIAFQILRLSLLSIRSSTIKVPEFFGGTHTACTAVEVRITTQIPERLVTRKIGRLCFALCHLRKKKKRPRTGRCHVINVLFACTTKKNSLQQGPTDKKTSNDSCTAVLID